MPEFISNVENEIGFDLPDEVRMPPCADIFPDGLTLKLVRTLDVGQEHGKAFYVGQTGDGCPTPVVELYPVYDDFNTDAALDMIDVAPAWDEDRERLSLAEGRPNMDFGLRGNDDEHPFGMMLCLTVKSEPEKMAESVERQVAQLAFTQAATRMVAIRNKELELEREQESTLEQTPPRGRGGR